MDSKRVPHMELAAAALERGDIHTAMTSYARAFDLDPTDLTPINKLIEMLADLGSWHGAVAALDMSRQSKPSPEIEVALDLARIELTQDTPEAIIDDLIANVMQRGPRSQLAVARTLVDMGRSAEATTLVQQTAAIASLSSAERAELHCVEGNLAESTGARERAIECYVACVRFDAARADAATNAVSLLLVDASPEALQRAEDLLAMLTDTVRIASPALAFNEARVHRRQGRAADCRVCLERVLALTGDEDELAHLARQALAELA